MDVGMNVVLLDECTVVMIQTVMQKGTFVVRNKSQGLRDVILIAS